MSDRETVLLAHGFVLHQRPYRNTSQLVECLTASHGRIGLIARGSRGSSRGQRAFLQPFTPLRLSWTRRGDLGQLTHVEPAGPAFALERDRLLAGYYVNELLLRLLERGDANDPVYSCYSGCLSHLAEGPSTARALRLFELRLLQALGYGPELDHDPGTGEALHPERRYVYEPGHGPRLADDRVADGDTYTGRALLALGQEALDDDESLKVARRLLGSILSGHLGGRPLKSRLVLKDIIARGL